MISNLSQIMPATLPKTRETASIAPSPATGGATVGSVQGSAVVANTGSAQTSSVTTGQSGMADQSLAEAIDKLNSKIQNLNRNLEFSLDEVSGELVVKVVDAQTHEVIRQIPRKEALEIASHIEQYMQDHHIGLVQAKA
jgi:flagellar protein FlaG